MIPRVGGQDLMWELAADRVEPLPDSWLEAGTISAAAANSQRTGPPWAKATDYIPRVIPPEPLEAQKMRWVAYYRARRRKQTHGPRS